MKKLFYIALVLLASCGHDDKKNPEFAETAEHLKYKLLAIGDNKKVPKLNDVLRVAVTYKTSADSVFWDSKYQAPTGYFLKVIETNKSGNFTDYLNKLSEDDSIEFHVGKEVFFKETFGTEIPVFFLNDTFVKVNLKVLMIHSPEEYELIEKNNESSNTSSEEEKLELQNYCDKNLKAAVKYDNGIYIQWIDKRPNGQIVESGKRIWVVYEGSFMDGRVVDKTAKGKVFEVRYGEQDQLIPGLEYALNKLKKGEKAKIVLPSHLAFGKEGSTNKMIPPDVPMIYELSIRDIR